MWKADIAKVIIAVTYFRKTLHRRCLTGFLIYQGSEYASGFEYARILNMSQVLNMPGF